MRRMRYLIAWIVRSRARRRVLAAAGLVALALALLAAACDAWVHFSTRGAVFDDGEATPMHDVALALGTSRRVRAGRPNLYFRTRMEAAARLYQAGKIRHIIVSGSNPSTSYDEATDMLKALVDLGVPREAVTRDYAGFRALDSVVRCKEVFGQDSVIIVSQAAHNRRAIFLARRYGLDAVGYNAEDYRRFGISRQRIREAFARCKAVLDLYVLGTEPKFLGAPVDVPTSPPSDAVE